MSDSRENQPIRTVPDTMVCTECKVCRRGVIGHIGLRLVNHAGIVGVEVYVCDETNMHLLARVELEVLPFVRWNDANSSATARK